MKSEGITENLIKDKTAGDLYDFLQSAAWKNIISESLSAHLRAAIKKIFSVTAQPGEFWRDAKLIPNINGLITILRAQNSGDCSEKTIEAYERRYYRSLRLYIDHLKSSFISSTAAPSGAPFAVSSGSPVNPVAPTTGFNPPSSNNQNLQNLAVQKVLAASLKFQQEVLSALSLLTQQDNNI